MIWLCIRGALIFILCGGSMIFWIWLLCPFPGNTRYGTPEYSQAKADSFTAMIGGMGLLVALGFIAAVVLSYWNPWKH